MLNWLTNEISKKEFTNSNNKKCYNKTKKGTPNKIQMIRMSPHILIYPKRTLRNSLFKRKRKKRKMKLKKRMKTMRKKTPLQEG